MDGLLERRPLAHGSQALRAALAVMTDEGERTASRFEVDVRWLVLTSDLPAPQVNAPVLGYVADLLWPAQRLIVEVDSRRWHDGPFARRYTTTTARPSSKPPATRFSEYKPPARRARRSSASATRSRHVPAALRGGARIVR
jgi:hypothetical protein